MVDRYYNHVRCHSPFKHYEMYHGNSACGGSGNFGSIFNTTYNFNGGCFGGGGFMSGLGWGLGAGLANMFTGLMGNMFGGFGMFGGGMFGGGMFGGFGNFWGGGFGNFWGGGSSASSSSKSSKSKHCHCNCGDDAAKTKKSKEKDCVNKDQTTATGLQNEANALLKTKDADKAKDLYNKIVDKLDNLDDPEHAEQDKKQYEAILGTLKGAYDFELDGKKAKTAKIIGTVPAPVVPSNVSPDSADDVDEPDSGISAVTDMDDLLSKLGDGYDALSPEDKAKFDKKFKELLADLDIDDDLDLLTRLAKEPKLDTKHRQMVKNMFYEKEGMENVTEDELENETTRNQILKALKSVIDTSPVDDFKNKTCESITKVNDKYIIKFKNIAKNGVKVPYTQITAEMADGELIFHGLHDNQHYALQKHTETGEYKLMQYAYHEGHGDPDVTSK